MPRVKHGPASRHRRQKVLNMAEGFKGTRSRLHRSAKQSLFHALAYQYRDRRTKKRDMRSLWITRINAAARLHQMSYSEMIYGLKLAGIVLDRKVMADLAVNNPEAFATLAGQVRDQLATLPPQHPTVQLAQA